MHQPQVALAALFHALVVEQHVDHVAIGHAVAIRVDLRDGLLSAVVVAGQHHLDVLVRSDHTLVDFLRNQSQTARGEQVLVEVEDGHTVGIPREHIIHPLDLLVADAPAHVHHDEVDATGGHQVVMALVVLVAAAVPRVGVVPVLTEAGGELRVVLGLVIHVMVAGKHTVREPGLVETLVLFVRPSPLVVEFGVIDHIAGVEHVGDVHPVTVLEQPGVDVLLVLEVPIVVVVGVVVLRVGLPREREVIVLAWGVGLADRIVGHGDDRLAIHSVDRGDLSVGLRGHTINGGRGGKVTGRITGTVLDYHGHRAVSHMVGIGHILLNRGLAFSVGLDPGHLIPCAGGHVPDERIQVGTGFGGTVPTNRGGSGRVGRQRLRHLHREGLVREPVILGGGGHGRLVIRIELGGVFGGQRRALRPVSHTGLAGGALRGGDLVGFSRNHGLAAVEGHAEFIVRLVGCAHAQRRLGAILRFHGGDGRILLRRGEGHFCAGGVACIIGDGEGDGVLARRQIDRGCRIRQFDRFGLGLPVGKGCAQRTLGYTGGYVRGLGVDGDCSALDILAGVFFVGDVGGDDRLGVIDRDRGLGAVRTELRGYRMLAVSHRGGVPQILVGGHGGFRNLELEQDVLILARGIADLDRIGGIRDFLGHVFLRHLTGGARAHAGGRLARMQRRTVG